MLGSPFPIELPEPHPVGGDRLSPGVLALSLSNLDALTLSLFKWFSFKLRECSEHGQHKFARRRVGVDFLLVADKGNSFVGEGVDDVQQILCRPTQTADAFHIEGISLTHIVKHCPELRADFVRSRNLLGEDAVNLITAHDLLLSRCFLMLRRNTDITYFAHSIVLPLFKCIFISVFCLCPLTAFLSLTLHILLIKVLAHLSGVPHRRFMFEKICLVFGHNGFELIF